MAASLLRCSAMKVVALAGGIGAGKFLRGMARLVPGHDLTVIVQRRRRRDRARAAREPRSRLGDVLARRRVRPRAWLGSARRDVPRDRGAARVRRARRVVQPRRSRPRDPRAPHFDARPRAPRCRRSIARDRRRGSASEPRLLPVTDDRVETRIDAVDASTGDPLDLHFQEYWVQRRAVDPVKGVRFVGADAARPAPGVLEAIARRRRRRAAAVEPGRLARTDPRGARRARGGRGPAPGGRRA